MGGADPALFGGQGAGSVARRAPGRHCTHWKRGYVAPPHKHLAGAHAFIISGKLQVRNGVLNAGDYISAFPASCTTRRPRSKTRPTSSSATARSCSSTRTGSPATRIGRWMEKLRGHSAADAPGGRGGGIAARIPARSGLIGDRRSGGRRTRRSDRTRASRAARQAVAEADQEHMCTRPHSSQASVPSSRSQPKSATAPRRPIVARVPKSR